MSTRPKKPLHFVVSSALLMGSLASCGNDVPPNEPMPETNVGQEEPATNEPHANEPHGNEPHSNEPVSNEPALEEAEPQVYTNEVLPEQPADD